MRGFDDSGVAHIFGALIVQGCADRHDLHGCFGICSVDYFGFILVAADAITIERAKVLIIK